GCRESSLRRGHADLDPDLHLALPQRPPEPGDLRGPLGPDHPQPGPDLGGRRPFL
ncbi:MAG: hypothetical protein AVDCRST_MAG05-4474, partial [uncultured Rubrobacteraceae bacterium]